MIVEVRVRQLDASKPKSLERRDFLMIEDIFHNAVQVELDDYEGEYVFEFNTQKAALDAARALLSFSLRHGIPYSVWVMGFEV